MSNSITKRKLSTENHPGSAGPFTSGEPVNAAVMAAAPGSVADFAEQLYF